MNEDENKNLKRVKLISFIIPIICSILPPLFIILATVLFVLGLFDVDTQAGDSDGIVSSTQTTNEICSSITVEGIGSMSLDEYVAGVVGGEVGLFTGHPEIQKALAIAARSYGLAGATKDGNGNCSVPNGEGFQVYKASAVNDTILRIVEETKGMILVDKNGNVVSAEYDSILIVKSYDSSGDTVTLKQRNLEIPKSWLIKVREPYVSCPINSENGKSLNKLRSSYSGYGCGHGRGMSQWGGLYLEMENGYDYVKILDFFYGKESGYNYSLVSGNSLSGDDVTDSGTSSNNGTLKPLSSYNIGHAGLKKLNRTFDSSEITQLNSFINSEVDKAGYGTGSGVASAAQSLVFGLEQKGYYLGYYWGGDRSSIGVGTRWGKNVGYAYTRGGNPTGPEFGMDCSGFVSWSIRNACKSDFGGPTAKTYLNNYGKKLSSIDKAKPGDILVNSGHVILVIKNNGDGSVITAEEAFSAGLVFKRYTSKALKEYVLKDMSVYYDKNCNDSR